MLTIAYSDYLRNAFTRTKLIFVCCPDKLRHRAISKSPYLFQSYSYTLSLSLLCFAPFVQPLVAVAMANSVDLHYQCFSAISPGTDSKERASSVQSKAQRRVSWDRELKVKLRLMYGFWRVPRGTYTEPNWNSYYCHINLFLANSTLFAFTFWLIMKIYFVLLNLIHELFHLFRYVKCANWMYSSGWACGLLQ